MISDHILCMHRYRSPGEQDGEGMTSFLIRLTQQFFSLKHWLQNYYIFS